MPRATQKAAASSADETTNQAPVSQNIRQLSVHPSEPVSPTPVPQGLITPTNRQDLQEDVDEEPLDNPFTNQPTPNLAEAIMLMTQELRRRENTSSPRTKVKEPDTFDGSDPRKLNNFILLCNLFFRNNSAYSDDDAKVTFALSHLRGTALEFFEPSILDSDDTPDWMDDWSAFIRNLRTQFGPIDPTADAEDGIDNLKMRENQRIVRYNVDFNRLAIQTGWDDSVLRHRYYSGLAERIKDIMGQQGKPSSLDAMKNLAHSIDSRHWERLREKSRSDKPKSDNRPDHKSDKKPNNQPSSSSNSNFQKKNQSKDSTHHHKSNKPSSSSNPIADKLGKDGKLTPQERQRRFDNNLCMFCGGIGHTANSCPKSTSSASKAKGRAVQATQAKEKTKESEDSKK